MDDEDIEGDIDALVVGQTQLKSDEALGQAFLREWSAFESVATLFFGNLDACYRAELKRPLMTNLEANLDALQRVLHEGRAPKLFKEPLDYLRHLGELCKVGELRWSGRNVWRERGCARRYFKVHDGFFVPVDSLAHLTDRCQRLAEELQREYESYRDFEFNVQMLVLLLNQKQLLSAESRRHAGSAYGVLCDLYAANLKLDGKLGAGFVSGSDGKAMDVQFKVGPSVGRMYDLAKGSGSAVAAAVEELKKPLHELIQAIKAKHKERRCKPLLSTESTHI